MTPDDRLNDHERRIGVLEQSDQRRSATLANIQLSVGKLETETAQQTTLLNRILGGIAAMKWVIGGVAVLVPALWWLFQQLQHLPK